MNRQARPAAASDLSSALGPGQTQKLYSNLKQGIRVCRDTFCLLLLRGQSNGSRFGV